MKALIDTCVILDALQNRQPFAKESAEIFAAAASGEFSGYITAKSTADIYYLVHRLLHDKKKTQRIMTDLTALFDLTDTAASDCFNALAGNYPDYEDGIMAETAKRTGMDCIVTRNERDYAQSQVKVCSPAEFVEVLKSRG